MTRQSFLNTALSLLIGAVVGAWAFQFFGARSASDALMVFLANEMSRHERDAARLFEKLPPQDSAEIQRTLIDLAVERRKANLLDERDYHRILGFARLRMGVDLKALGKKEEAQRLIDEGVANIKASGMAVNSSELVQTIEQAKKLPR